MSYLPGLICRRANAPVIILRSRLAYPVKAMMDQIRNVRTRSYRVPVRRKRDRLASMAIVRVEIVISGSQRIDKRTQVRITQVTGSLITRLVIASSLIMSNEKYKQCKCCSDRQEPSVTRIKAHQASLAQS